MINAVCGRLHLLFASVGLVTLSAVGVAGAGETLIQAEIGSDRDPYDFADPTSTKYELTIYHTFDNGVVITGMGEVSETLFSTSVSENLEATAGFTRRFNTAFSMTGRLGVGELFQGADDGGDFPYYVFYLSANLDLTKKFTWNAVMLEYATPSIPPTTTIRRRSPPGVTYKLNDHNWILAKVSRSWQDEAPHDTGVTLGYQYGCFSTPPSVSVWPPAAPPVTMPHGIDRSTAIDCAP